ncbi:hypothetical protein [Phocaeicola sartorii]|uniref:hypothetical protein n=1 Tax=Phocaeicola sartorii TaxID=671267 RepID=UPI002558299E|nr:hypothetical protein [Phocaeicola sartorii]
MIDVLYYMYYLFYSKKITVNFPHLNTLGTLCYIFMFWEVSIVEFISTFFFLYHVPVGIHNMILLLGNVLIIWIYGIKKRGKYVVKKKKPLIRGSFRLSAIFAILLFIMSFVIPIIMIEVTKDMKEYVEPMYRVLFGK